jgi:hypothetical protein
VPESREIAGYATFPAPDLKRCRTVAYSNAAGAHHEGFLRPGETVKAKPTGTEFHVSNAGKS